MTRLEGKTAIVTGGAHGVGRSAALLLAREGARVAVVDLADELGQSVVQEICDSGGVAEYFHMNVADEADVKRVFEDVRRRFGSIDVLVNHAEVEAVNRRAGPGDAAVQGKKATGLSTCARYAIRAMQASGGGSIIDLSEANSPPPSLDALTVLLKGNAKVYAGGSLAPMVDRISRRTSPDSSEPASRKGSNRRVN
jgi:NAD(P)-dependent dehydrogenase (short-subunit alcohol dehydrogenase family)